ncbi:MAG: Clp1/GlmU family protein [Syntrophaceae bacterium]
MAEKNGMVHVEPAWEKVLGEVSDPGHADIVYVVGGLDTGKTTLCGFLKGRLAALAPAALIDCDPGQSVIGPPATVGALLPDGSMRLRFVGATSPRGHLLQTVSGIKRLTDLALAAGARKVVLDSSGLVSGALAAEFQFGVLDLVRPTHIIALQRGLELEGLLASFMEATHILRLMASKAVAPRTPNQRQAYRRERFRRYFQTAHTQDLSIEGRGRHGKVPVELTTGHCRNLLVALCSSDGFVLVLGIIEAVDQERDCLALYAPPFDADRVVSIQFGSIKLEQSGQEMV